MATVIKLKRSTTASAVPTTSDLADGEIAVNITDQKIYIRNGGSIVELANASGADFSSVGEDIIPATTESGSALKSNLVLAVFSPPDLLKNGTDLTGSPVSP